MGSGGDDGERLVEALEALARILRIEAWRCDGGDVCEGVYNTFFDSTDRNQTRSDEAACV